jgi:hypothetical protein
MPRTIIFLIWVDNIMSYTSVACNRCDRRGQLRTACRVTEHGADMPMPDLLRILSADCPRRQAMERGFIADVCGTPCPQLTRLPWQNLPLAERFQPGRTSRRREVWSWQSGRRFPSRRSGALEGLPSARSSGLAARDTAGPREWGRDRNSVARGRLAAATEAFHADPRKQICDADVPPVPETAV